MVLPALIVATPFVAGGLACKAASVGYSRSINSNFYSHAPKSTTAGTTGAVMTAFAAFGTGAKLKPAAPLRNLVTQPPVIKTASDVMRHAGPSAIGLGACGLIAIGVAGYAKPIFDDAFE